MYAVEVGSGRAEPVPAYVSDWLLARWMGITRPQLMEMPLQDVEEARTVMRAINEAEDAMHRRAGK